MVLASHLLGKVFYFDKELDKSHDIPALDSGSNQILLLFSCSLYPFSLDGSPSCVEELDAQGSQPCSACSFSPAS